MVPADDKAVHDLLDFYLEAGVDALLTEEPVDRFAVEETPPARALSPSVAAPPSPTLPQPKSDGSDFGRSGHGRTRVNPSSAAGGSEMPSVASPPPPDAAAMEARQAAKSANSLEELRAILETFGGCALKATATQLVFADGNPQSRVMLVGEAPGRDEDIEGLPFVGRSGKLLDRMLSAIGLDRTQVYIANVVPWRPPGNRDPSPHETAICLPFIRRQIELADPDILVCLGKPSMQTLLETSEPIGKARGRWFTFNTGTREIRAMPTFHPAFLLRSPLQKRFAWRDFLAIKKALAN
jgi:uracil-DNA glycosylase